MKFRFWIKIKNIFWGNIYSWKKKKALAKYRELCVIGGPILLDFLYSSTVEYRISPVRYLLNKQKQFKHRELWFSAQSNKTKINLHGVLGTR